MPVPAAGESEKVMKDCENNQIGVAADSEDKNINTPAISTEGV